jgi:esterase/lipase
MIPSGIIRTAKLLQMISTGLAARFAALVFGTPLRHERSERELAFMESAQVSQLHIPAIDKNIQVFTYGYSRKKVLLVHGWSGRGTQMYRIADKLLEHGYMVISFDAPAHGDSDGKTTLIIEFIASIMALQKIHGPFVAAIGHSLGGMALLNAIGRGLKLEKVVSISAGDDIEYFFREFVSKLQLKEKVFKKLKKGFQKRFGIRLQELSGGHAAKEVMIPALVVHDKNDKEVPVSCAQGIRQNLKIGSLLLTEGLGHRRILHDEQVITDIVKFIDI